jgi:ribosomal-protein-alanine N-acetyltransferase
VVKKAEFELASGRVTLLAMRRRHLRAVMRIEDVVYPKPWTLSLFLSELAQRDMRAYHVACSASRIVGYSGLMLAGEEAHVTTIAVDPQWQRRKVGTCLLANMVKVAKSRGSSNLTLEVRVANKGAQALYFEFGFQPAGIRSNYYSETGEDALIMWACGIDTPEYAERLAGIEARLALSRPPPASSRGPGYVDPGALDRPGRSGNPWGAARGGGVIGAGG